MTVFTRTMFGTNLVIIILIGFRIVPKNIDDFSTCSRNFWKMTTYSGTCANMKFHIIPLKLLKINMAFSAIQLVMKLYFNENFNVFLYIC